MFLLITKAKQMYLHKDSLEEQNEYKRGANRKKNMYMYSDNRKQWKHPCPQDNICLNRKVE